MNILRDIANDVSARLARQLDDALFAALRKHIEIPADLEQLRGRLLPIRVEGYRFDDFYLLKDGRQVPLLRAHEPQFSWPEGRLAATRKIEDIPCGS